MSEYINRAELLRLLRDDLEINGANFARVRDHINSMEAADVVERKRGEWVSVEERLPDIELVEAKANDMEYFPCLAVIKSTVSVLGRYVSKLWYGEEGFIDQDVCPMDDVVTHWMPLPEPPNCDMRGEKNEGVH